ncbi:MAG: class I SAM-dependent methyltransferase [Myxococcales bacterium]|nr:class I SAM-dependent methyltransferase [Myxococcales bacterium]
MQFLPDALDAYVHDHTRPRPPLLDELRDHTLAHVPSPQMQVGRVEGTFLKMLAAMIGARRVVEIGTYTGYSALCLAEGMPPDGRVITCDKSEEFTGVAKAFWAKSEHGAKIELRLGDALETLAALEPEPLDMAFLDADKARYPDYYEALVPRLREGGLLVIDNVLWSGQVLDPQTDDARGIVAVNRRAVEDPRVENVLLPVRDGMMLVRKL